MKEEDQDDVEDELETCARQKDMLESQAREAFAKAKVIVAKLERTAIERRKKVRRIGGALAVSYRCFTAEEVVRSRRHACCVTLNTRLALNRRPLRV